MDPRGLGNRGLCPVLFVGKHTREDTNTPYTWVLPGYPVSPVKEKPKGLKEILPLTGRMNSGGKRGIGTVVNITV